MTSLAIHDGTPRHDVFRWFLCFAVMAAAHGAAMMALLRAPPPGDDFTAGAPVVMIELPEAAAALSNPPSDLPPGPVEPESEQTPPPKEETAQEEFQKEDFPKEETKLPHEVAEVTLPMPEPIKDLKPEPVAEEKPATAPPSVAVATPAPPVAGAEVETISAAVRRWESALVAHLERFKHYPAEARARGLRGFAKVAFTIDRDGRLRESRIIESSGSPELDRETLAMLTRAQPMPKPPGEVRTNDLSFVVPVRFNLR